MIHIGALVGAGLSQFKSDSMGINLAYFQRFRNPEDRFAYLPRKNVLHVIIQAKFHLSRRGGGSVKCLRSACRRIAFFNGRSLELLVKSTHVASVLLFDDCRFYDEYFQFCVSWIPLPGSKQVF